MDRRSGRDRHSHATTHVPGGRAIVFGEVLFDYFPDGRRVLGGAPFNTAWHLCALGDDPFLVTAVGDDAQGHEIRDAMESWGFDTRGVRVDHERLTGRVEVKVAAGTPSFEIPEDQPWDHLVPHSVLDPSSDVRAALLYHGTLALRSADSRAAFEVIRARLAVPAFVDLNLRAPWWTRERVDRAVDGATWLKLSDQELGTLTGASLDDPDELKATAVAFRRERRIPVLVVTRGADGALAVAADGSVLEAAGVPVPDLVDSVGAGDAFSALWCHGILKGWAPEVTLPRAVAFAADVCRHQGATSGDLTLYERHVRAWVDEPVSAQQAEGTSKLYVLSVSVHGLVRGQEIELGRDADTGGQVGYVVDQARALAQHPQVERVDLVTRAVHDKGVDDAYAQPNEDLGEGARIVRIPFGPRRYLKKESLWPHLDGLMDQLTRHVRAQNRLPDVIHGHYADAGYVGAQLAKLLGVPFVFTGHSLGRVKRRRLEEEGGDPGRIEARYNLTRRIEAEEQALESAALVVASTHQEVSHQYEGYDHYLPERMKVIPPGVDLERFSPPTRSWTEPAIAKEVRRFLRDPDKPLVLALARADERKNFGGLLRAFGETPELREVANLLLVAGNRDDIAEMDAAPRRVLTGILVAIDRWDLHGSVAYPKHHHADDVPDLYRMAAHSRGLFVNPALTEPFGLTLIEAAATGLPVVATDDGGPRDILDVLDHGVLVDVLDTAAMGSAILSALLDRGRWARWSKNAVTRVHERFAWKSHARRYVEAVRDVMDEFPTAPALHAPRRLPRMDRMLVTDLDGTLTGDDARLAELRARLRAAGSRVGFGIATGRSLSSTHEVLSGHPAAPRPDVLITASGTALHYGPRRIRDRSWERQIRYRWDREAIRRILDDMDGLEPFAEEPEEEYRLRYVLDPEVRPTDRQVRAKLRQAGLHATIIIDRQTRLDVVPVRASPGLAIRFVCFKWNLPPQHLLVAGDSGNDVDMLSGDTLGVVVGNHTPELEALRGMPRVHFADAEHAAGVLEGIDHYDFFGTIRIPDQETA